MAFHPDQPFTFYFVRHGVTEPNFRGLRCGGDLDVPLLDIGLDQAYLLAKQIRAMNLDIGLIICGSLARTRQTALIVSGVLGGVDMLVEPLINERKLGQWNNRPIAETEEALKRKDTPPGGESEEEFTRRIAGAIEHLSPHFSRRPLLVSSKGVGRILNDLLGGEGRLQVGNGEIVCFDVVPDDAGGLKLAVSRPHQV